MSEIYSRLSANPPENLCAFYTQLEETLDEPQRNIFTRYFARSPARVEQFHLCLHASIFVQQEILRRPHLFLHLLADDAFASPLAEEDLDNQLATASVSDSIELDKQLREFRAQGMLRIIWRDLNRIASCSETTADLSALARASIRRALSFHYQALTQKHGTPRGKDGARQPLLVLGMGKLGAQELNLSSDIDLIFTYPDQGETDAEQLALSNQDFFSRLGKKIIRSLDAKTADGIVFRVDMRLRPYGQSGALVYSFGALEEYYQTQGREWERYAMVKASVIANNGDAVHGTALMAMLRSFTYRKYVDFSVIEALRNLKKMIVLEVKRRGLEEDVKLGAGGIREIEFTAQVFQLIRGGREPRLQDNRILKILPLLAEANCLPGGKVDDLVAAYIFLRNTEHAIQAYKDEQTQMLPSSADARAALVIAMGFSSWDRFYARLGDHRRAVKEVFTRLIATADSAEAHSERNSVWMPLWQNRIDRAAAVEQLEDAGHEDAQASFAHVTSLHDWARHSAMHASSRERLDTFMPALLAALAQQRTPTEILARLARLIRAVTRRSAYLLLLIENPGALTQLLKLSEASPWFADRMAQHPALLDELLDARSLYRLPLKSELQAELRRSVLRISEHDLEAQMETLRYFRSAHALRVAACELTGALPLMKVSDYLTIIAEVVLDYVLMLCWHEMLAQHGYPDGEMRDSPNFIIVGYGKLGGIELGHGSDLDLVFIHNSRLNGCTDGERSLDNQTFFTRLGQKIIHFLTANMSSGPLYDVDMRLRPSGNSGMLVTSLSSFLHYQEKSAWTWEHQALVRARVVAGDAALAEEFAKVRAKTLCRQRDLATLRDDVIAMRQKMRDHLGNKQNAAGRFHLKHDAGGIVDIEFMVQYGVLAWAHSHPALVTFTDNIRILESLVDSDLLAAQEVSQLIAAYKAFRAAGHRLTLQQQPNLVAADSFICERRAVADIWRKLMGE